MLPAIRGSLLAFTLLAANGVRAEAYVALAGGNEGVTRTAAVLASIGYEAHNAFIDVSAFGYGHLASGTMGVFVSATPHSPILGGPTASGEVRLSDGLILQGPGSAPVPVTFTMDVDALLHLVSIGAAQGGRLHFVAEFGFGGINQRSIEIERQLSSDENGTITTNTIDCWGECSSVNVPLTTAGVLDATLSFTALLSPGFISPFTAYLNAWTATTNDLQGTVDALNTAQLAVSLPAGYTLSSQSGVFLTQPVPEPATWLSMLAGVGGLLGWHLAHTPARRRLRQPAPA